ncbi:MAG: hypothetical protein ABI743_02615 [bacterium]
MDRWISRLFALVTGLIIGLLDLGNGEVQPAVVLLLFFGAVLGFSRPHSARDSALLLGIGIPIMQVVAQINHWQFPGGIAPDPVGAWLSLIPAAMGVAAGWMLARMNERENPQAA